MKLLARFRKAAALPFVLLLVALNVIVVVALMVYATTELQASRNSGQAEVARALAQSGIDIAAGLIAANSTNNGFVSYQRVISNSPTDFRLETKIGNVVATNPAMPWKTTLVTNPSVLHSGFSANTNPANFVDLNFAVRGDSNSNAGFIAPRVNTNGWTNLSTNMFRMDWIYVYKGPTNDSKNLIGRIAYWVDDESSKLNINYSGATNIYGGDWIRASFYGPRGSKGPNAGLGQEFNGNIWPLFMEMGGVAGLSTTNVNEIIKTRGSPIWRSDDSAITTFIPYPSPLAARIATIPPASGGMGLATLLQQSQLGFTTTIYSREPELSYAKGLPRFDLFDFTTEWASVPAKRTKATNEFLTSLNNNYPEFADKYSLPQYVAAILSSSTVFGSGSNAVVNFPYASTAGETPNYNNRALPLINETSLKLQVQSDGTNQTATFDAAIELVFMSGASDFRPNNQDNPDYQIFDELAVKGSRFESGYTNYSAVTEFNPALKIGTNLISRIQLKPSSSEWFSNSIGLTNCLKIYGTNLAGCFAVLKGQLVASNASSLTNLIWQLPQVVTTKIYYFGTNAGNLYQTVSANVTQGPVVAPQTNTLSYTNSTKELVFHLVSQPQRSQGVRGDPRLGLHEVSCIVSPTNTLLPVTSTNTSESIGKLNTTWDPGSFEGETLSPDITPPDTVFLSDRGYRYNYGNFFDSSGMLGEIPITTFKGGSHLAWSTPRFWGDGRTNMPGGPYPPDWLMLDCVHTSMFPPDTNRIFTDKTNAFISYGRVNANGLKSFFQQTKGSVTSADNIIDSVLVRTDLKDFKDWDLNRQPPNYGSITLPILIGETARTNLVTNVIQRISTKNSANNPFLTPFDFTAEFPTYTNVTNYPKYITYKPGATNTSDKRLEAAVRALQQRVTTHGNQFSIFSLAQALQVVNGKTNVVGESYIQAVYERAPKHNETTGAITNGAANGAPPMRQLYLRELRY